MLLGSTAGVWNCAAWVHLDRSQKSLMFSSIIISPTRLAIFHCAFGLRMQASGPSNSVSTQSFFVPKDFPQIRRAQAQLPFFFLHLPDFGGFYSKIKKNCTEIDVLDVFYAMKRLFVFKRRKPVFSSCECSML